MGVAVVVFYALFTQPEVVILGEDEDGGVRAGASPVVRV